MGLWKQACCTREGTRWHSECSCARRQDCAGVSVHTCTPPACPECADGGTEKQAGVLSMAVGIGGDGRAAGLLGSAWLGHRWGSEQGKVRVPVRPRPLGVGLRDPEALVCCSPCFPCAGRQGNSVLAAWLRGTCLRACGGGPVSPGAQPCLERVAAAWRGPPARAAVGTPACVQSYVCLGSRVSSLSQTGEQVHLRLHDTWNKITLP